MIRIERHPSRRQLIVFGLLWLVFFSFWGTASWWNAGINWKAAAFWSLAFLIPAAGIFRSEVLRIVYVLAASITFPIGMVISSAVLMVIYYAVITPIGVVMRLSGYDPMKRNFDRSARTYWSSRKPEVETERYFKQF
jgi:hypothetical protein